MAIVLAPGHPRASLAGSDGEPADPSRLRIGIINIMPRLEAYEPCLLEPLAEHPAAIEPVFIRLGSHGYQSSDHAHLDRFYRPFERAIADAPLDGLIVTGAPVEELAFEDVHYFRELEAILGHARDHVAVTLGLCWGGMVIGRLAGIDKQAFARKLFGVFEDRVLVPGHDIVGTGAFVCAHSRHSGVVEADLEAATRTGVVRPLSRGEATGTTMFETTDRRWIAHLGHPEYTGERIAFEWQRDQQLGRADVRPPANFDPASPATPWRGHRRALFAGFLRRALHGRAAAIPADHRDAPSATQYCP
jgi:homoserine O-succinyltransferase